MMHQRFPRSFLRATNPTQMPRFTLDWQEGRASIPFLTKWQDAGISMPFWHNKPQILILLPAEISDFGKAT
jgi:hypothetical protein